MSKSKSKQKSVNFDDEVRIVKDDEMVVERVVPVSEAEILGMFIRKDNSGVLLEFGYSKNDSTNTAIIDTRKKLPIKMARELYEKLKRHFEKENESSSEA
ncbi:hypothetical protein IRT38_15790 [Acinetobacter sp. SK-43]|uniref:hypothetical protein n=1 Tax=Acinetobacter sp. SK-43 TaxID=2785295 RepID=UPI00188A77D4|nr:hypothetical protein [Acinetobacter sp. SK-43]MBF4456799.1 hypothetical protein [Acinetobacter sp. SK-43]